MDMRAQHHDIGDFEPAEQQRQQAQIGRQHVDPQRRVGGGAALQPDVVERDVAARKHRDVDLAVDHELEPGDGADLRFHRLSQRVAVEEPGGSDQADQRHAKKRSNRHAEALHSLGHRQ
jgi:hypothetical protein